MPTDDFIEAARAEAERRWPYSANPDPTPAEDEGAALNAGFMDGAEWARTHLAAQEPTDAEVEAAPCTAICWGEPDDYRCTCGFSTGRSRRLARHIADARRDEEKR